MNGIGAVAGVGAPHHLPLRHILGVLVIASISFNRDPLKGTPPDSASSGTRWLVGVSRRDHQPGQVPPSPEESPGQGRGQGW